MARYQSDHHAKTHAKLVQKAASMIRERGLDGTSVATLMRAEGLTHGGFYAHFADKDGMLAEAIAVAIAPSAERFARLAARATQTGDVGTIAQAYLSDRNLAAIGDSCAAAALASELHRAPAPVRRCFQDGAAAAAQALAPAFPKDAAAIDAPAPWGAYAMLVGALALMRAIPDAHARTEIRDRVAADLRSLAKDR